jgi:hypothetical protein
VSGQLAGAPTSIFESQPSGLLTIIVLLLLWVSGAFCDGFTLATSARPSSIHLGPPRFVAMSAADAADAAQLLGSSVAALVASDWKEA